MHGDRQERNDRNWNMGNLPKKSNTGRGVQEAYNLHSWRPEELTGQDLEQHAVIGPGLSMEPD